VADRVHSDSVKEVVADKGYHSNETMMDFAELEIRTYVSEPDRPKRDWEGKEAERDAVYANRRRIHGKRGRDLSRKRGELIERSFAHTLETGSMRRVHLRGGNNILKRMLIHVGGFNLSLVMRQLIGKGTPRGLQGSSSALFALIYMPWEIALTAWRRWKSSACQRERFYAVRCAV
jgi:transposase